MFGSIRFKRAKRVGEQIFDLRFAVGFISCFHTQQSPFRIESTPTPCNSPLKKSSRPLSFQRNKAVSRKDTTIHAVPVPGSDFRHQA